MLKKVLEQGRENADAALERLLPPATQYPVSIHQAMRHSVFAGGKRLRPVLCMEAGRMIAGSSPPGIEELGAALEMLHTYSLIHDDLPALDNDDLRRGRPTCHKVFGDAIAILAGDALQTQAYEIPAGREFHRPAFARRLQPISQWHRRRLCDRWAAPGEDRHCRARAGHRGSANKCAASPRPRLALRFRGATIRRSCGPLPCTEPGVGACRQRTRCAAWLGGWIGDAGSPAESAGLAPRR